MGILDTAKAFAHVGVTKAGRVVTGAAVKGAHLAGDAASKGAAKLNRAADQLNDDSAEGTTQSTTQSRPPSNGRTTR